jgi:hypothetical protein
LNTNEAVGRCFVRSATKIFLVFFFIPYINKQQPGSAAKQAGSAAKQAELLRSEVVADTLVKL